MPGFRICPDGFTGVAVNFDLGIERPAGRCVGDGAADGVGGSRVERDVERCGLEGSHADIGNTGRIIAVERGGDGVGAAKDRGAVEAVGIGGAPPGETAAVVLDADGGSGQRAAVAAVADGALQGAGVTKDEGGFGGGKRVYGAAAPVVVGAKVVVAAAVGASLPGEGNGRLCDELLCFGHKAAQRRVCRPEQTDEASDVRASHAGAAPRLVATAGE